MNCVRNCVRERLREEEEEEEKQEKKKLPLSSINSILCVVSINDNPRSTKHENNNLKTQHIKYLLSTYSTYLAASALTRISGSAIPFTNIGANFSLKLFIF